MSSAAVSSRNSILDKIRAQQVPPAELPPLDHPWLRYEDPLGQFQTLVESVGGRVVRLADRRQLGEVLGRQPEFSAAREIVSAIPEVAGSVDLDAIDDPHQLETIDFVILPGEFAVAENGAVWVTDQALRHRVIYFITQHLALVVLAREIVHNLHEAYARVQLGASSLGLFISGPSKTADIEQSLVIGAHGPRSLTVYCVGAGD
jgi:L-lactate dehydrogenase complex protein LldG